MYLSSYLLSFKVHLFEAYITAVMDLAVLFLPQVRSREEISLVFTVPLPIGDKLPNQYYVRCSADRWLGTDTTVPISFQHLILPEDYPPHTGDLNFDVTVHFICRKLSSFSICLL